KAREGLKNCEEDAKQLAEARDRLLADAKEEGEKIDLSGGSARLQELGKVEKELQDFIAGQQAILKEENDPKRKQWLEAIQQAKLYEADAEWGKALEIYDNLLDKEGLKKDEVQKRRDKLKEAWTPRDDEHRKAQSFIYDVWPKLDALKLKSHIEQARAAVETCRKNNDTLAPQKMLRVGVAHGAKLKETLAALRVDLNEDDRKTAETIDDVVKDLTKLMGDVTKFLEEKSGK